MKPSGTSSWFNSANELFKAGRYAESRKLLIDLHKSLPGFIPAVDLLSIIDFKQKKYLKSKEWTQILIQYSSDQPDWINRMIMILIKLEEFAEAIRIMDKTLYSHPDHPGLVYNAIKLNALKGERGKINELLTRLPGNNPFLKKSREYLKNFSTERDALMSLLSESFKNRDWPKAIHTYREWLKLNDPSADSYFNLGLLCMNNKQFSESIHYFKKCIEFNPSFYISAFLYMWYCKLVICDWSDYSNAILTIDKRVKRFLKDPTAELELPVYILSFFDLDEGIFAKYGSKVYEKYVRNIEIPQTRVKSSNDKIRVGYISSSFWSHPIGRVYKDIFPLHDRTKFDVYVYSTFNVHDSVSLQIREGAVTFRDLTVTSTPEAYSIIKGDNLNILITAGGHGDDMNMELVAMKPAPLVINAHGYNESLGGDFADYIISDTEVVDDLNRKYFVENLIFLPHCSIPPFSLPVPEIKSRSYYDLPENAFVFLSASHPRKITPEIFMCWQKILAQSPNSILWIFDYGISDIRINLFNNLESEELRVRIFFSGMVPYVEHIGRYHLADLLLDTPLYNCHSVGMEALASGLPFITIKGTKANSRFGASMLKTAGLESLICYSKEEYVEKAVNYSIEPTALEIKKNILNRSNQILNTSRYVKELESSYKKIADIKQKQIKDLVDIYI